MKKTFESAMTCVEEIVKKLESGALSLEESLAAFEEAISLIKFCNHELDAAKQKVVMLTEGADGALAQTPFSIDET